MTARDSSSLKVWERWETLGFYLVLFGVVMEGAEFVPASFRMPIQMNPNDLKMISHLGWLVLVVGLAAELLGGKRAKRISDRENARLTIEASEANERSKQLESANLVLREKVLGLELRVQPINQQVTEIYAEATVLVRGEEDRRNPKPPLFGPIAFLSFLPYKADVYASNVLVCDEVDPPTKGSTDSGTVVLVYRLRFHKPDSLSFGPRFYSEMHPTVKVFLLGVEQVQLHTLFLPDDAELEFARVDILLNGLFPDPFINRRKDTGPTIGATIIASRMLPTSTWEKVDAVSDNSSSG